jgi:hypothetical protein
MNRDQPLSVAVEGEQLVVRIGIDTLAHSAGHCPQFYDYRTSRPDGPYKTIIDPEQLAKDVHRELLREEEDGSSPLSDLLDQAIVAAFYDGSAAFGEEP